jgi:hypothetical protein
MKAPRFPEGWSFQISRQRHMRMIRLSALRTGRFYPMKYSWYSFLLELSQPQKHSAAGSIVPMTPSGIEPATVWVVAQCLKQFRHSVPNCYVISVNIYQSTHIYKAKDWMFLNKHSIQFSLYNWLYTNKRTHYI